MFATSPLWTFLILVIGLTLVPGATTFLVLRRAITDGPRAGITTIAGGSLGVVVHAVVSALGLSALLVQSALLFEWVRLAGSAYLVWLGAQALLRAWRGDYAALKPADARRSHGAAFGEGLTTILLSPETALFYLAVLPQFISPGESVLLKSLLLATIHAGVRIVWYSIIAFGAGRLREKLAGAAVRRGLEGVSGLFLVLFGVRMALAARK